MLKAWLLAPNVQKEKSDNLLMRTKGKEIVTGKVHERGKCLM